MRKRELHCKAIAFMFAFWFAISWLQVIKDNSTGYGADVSWWNMFCVLGCIDANASEHMAIHEEQKGVIKAQYLEDLDCLARIIYAEGGKANYVSDDCCYYIGSVVINRVRSDVFPNSIKECVLQSGQYSTVHSSLFYERPNERSLQIAQELIDEGSKLPDNVLFQANFKQGSGVYAYTDTVYFLLQIRS